MVNPLRSIPRVVTCAIRRSSIPVESPLRFLLPANWLQRASGLRESRGIPPLAIYQRCQRAPRDRPACPSENEAGSIHRHVGDAQCGDDPVVPAFRWPEGDEQDLILGVIDEIPQR
jgi:hypothetical protein